MSQVVKTQNCPSALTVLRPDRLLSSLCLPVFPAAESMAATRPRPALDSAAGCIRFNLLADSGPPQTGGAAASLRGNGDQEDLESPENDLQHIT